jgi:uncharacterized protein YegL
MKNDHADITIIVDRSGSMQSCRSDAEGGVNSFIKEQAAQPGEARITLIQFDNKYEVVHNGVLAADIPEYKLQPRGMTALLDAVGKGIAEAGTRLEAIQEDDRPGCVVVVIVTDGHENSSVEYTHSQIRKIIEEQTTKYNWQFTYLGADAASFDDAKRLGVPDSGFAQYDKDKVDKAFVGASNAVSCCRMATARGEKANLSYSDEDRSEMV